MDRERERERYVFIPDFMIHLARIGIGDKFAVALANVFPISVERLVLTSTPFVF